MNVSRITTCTPVTENVMSRANGHSLHRTASIASRMFPRGPFSRVSFQALALQNFVSYWLNGGSIIVISFLFLSTWLQQEYINSSYRCSLSTSAHDNFCHNCYKINVSCKLVMFFFSCVPFSIYSSCSILQAT